MQDEQQRQVDTVALPEHTEPRMRTQHEFGRHSADRERSAFHSPWNHDAFKGDYLVNANSEANARMRRKVVGACSIVGTTARTRQSFQRSWAHIQQDAADVVVLCFVKQGSLRLQHPAGECLAQQGDFVSMRSTTPFSLESWPGIAGNYEAIHLIAPTHMLRQHLCRDVITGLCVPATGSGFSTLKRILSDLLENQGEVSEGSATMLMEAALSLLADAMKPFTALIPIRPSHTELRLRGALRYIDLHFSDPKLSVNSVAEGCKMSPRHLSSLLKAHGTTFSALVWGKRIKMAAQWLSTSSQGDAAISEIAFKTGFKSAAHFARMFKREFNASPRLFRESAARPRERSRPKLAADIATSHL